MSKGFALRGVIEGFYGRPWTHAQRLALMDFLGAHGYNLYVYAPKDDPFHRERWRDPYPPERLAQLLELAGRARAAGVAFCFAISPGLSLRYSDDAERDRLWGKIEPLISRGIACFGLFFDDIPPVLRHPEDRARFGSAAQAQAHAANALLTRIRARVAAPAGEGPSGARLLFCPTQYHGDPHSPYLQRLGELLDPEVQVFWTGPQVCSRELTVAHTRAVAEVLRRPPLYWDNYPVNDGLMAPELHIGPYTGREPGLAGAAAGMVLNPMPQYEASRWVLAAAAPYLTHPEGYDPIAAWRRVWRLAAEGRAPDGDAMFHALLHFAQANLESPLHPGSAEAYTEPIDRFLHAPMEERPGLALELEALFRRILREERLLRAFLPETTRQELEPWLDEYRRWAEVGLQALKVVEAVQQAVWAGILPAGEGLGPERSHPSAGDGPRQPAAAVARERERLRQLLEATLAFRTRVLGDGVRNLAIRIWQASAGYTG